MISRKLFLLVISICFFMLSDSQCATAAMKLTEVGHIGTPGAPNRFKVSGNYVYLPDSRGFRIINISNKLSPTPIASYNLPDSANDVFISGSYAYVANGSNGLVIFNISNPYSPQFVGNYSEENIYSNSVEVSGNYAYLANKKNFQIIDIRNPSLPQKVSSYEIPDYNNYCEDVAVSGQYAYIALREQGVEIINISNPYSPNKVTAYDTVDYCYRLTVSGNYLYAFGEFYLKILDISNITWVAGVGYWQKPYFFPYGGDIFVLNDNAYLALYDISSKYGISILDINPPHLTQEIGSYDELKDARSIAASGEYIYVGFEQYGFWIFRVSETTAEAGPDEIVFNIVSLDGSQSTDSDGVIVSYQWALKHRENSSYNKTAEGINPTISDLEKGFYDVTLTITDNDGNTDTDTMLLSASGSCDVDGDGKMGLKDCIQILKGLTGMK